MAVAEVDRADIDKFLHDVTAGKTAARVKTGRHGLARVKGGQGTATRTLGLLGAIFAYAVRQRMRPDNPCSLVVKFADNRRDRRLNDDEYAALGTALRQAETEGKMWPPAVAMTRLLALTGWRTGEVLTLQWSKLNIAKRTARLGDTKTGASVRPLSKHTCEVLKALPGMGDRVFPASRGGADMLLHFKKFWPKIAKLAGLPAEVTPHVLRHSLASLAADLGYSELAIAALLGHQAGSVTARYTHHADAVLLAAADAVANRTAELMGEHKPEAAVVPLRATR